VLVYIHSRSWSIKYDAGILLYINMYVEDVEVKNLRTMRINVVRDEDARLFDAAG
jgi:hypothetical protein